PACPTRPLHLRAGGRASRRRPRAPDCRRALAWHPPHRGAGQARLRLRPAAVAAGAKLQLGRTASRDQERLEPPRTCLRAPAGFAARTLGTVSLCTAPSHTMSSATPFSLSRPGHLGALPPLSLYVHLPWCLKKCPYCDFNSHEFSAAPGRLAPELQGRYLEALPADLASALPQIWGRHVHTIFIGGGTPSLFSPENIDQLLSDIRARLPLEAACEITLEANPGTFEKDRFKAFRQAGVNRLSIGVQSFDDAKLQALGRVHNRAQAIAAVEEAQTCFDTFNLDLMYALPGQTPADLEADIRQALAFHPPHLSLYHLTLEPNTVFATRPPKDLPDDDTAFDMLDHLIARATQAGLQRYEVSAYAQPGHQCLHNLNYW